jgi:hypothetical protein
MSSMSAKRQKPKYSPWMFSTLPPIADMASHVYESRP